MTSLNNDNTNPKSNVKHKAAARLVKVAQLNECGKRLRQGGLVAFPTETVYGLGGNALDTIACQSIFEAKERPLTDPLIVHVTDPIVALDNLWEHEGDENDMHRQILQCLVNNFWPGPLTLVAKANRAKVPDLVTANTGYVACRCPSHLLARQLIDAAQVPIAAPSANKFGHVSPTKACHVWDDLQHENVWILEEDEDDKDKTLSSSKVGVESSVVKLEMLPTKGNDNYSGNTPKARLTVLRHGAVSALQLEACLAQCGMGRDVVQVMAKGSACAKDNEATVSPGQTLRHYSPNVPSFMVAVNHQSWSLTRLDLAVLKDAVVIDFGQALVEWRDVCLTYRDLSLGGSSAEAARCVFETLRWAEAVSGATRIFFPDPTAAREGNNNDLEDALALAVKDRLTRAASGHVIGSLKEALLLPAYSSNENDELIECTTTGSSALGKLRERFFQIPPEVLALFDDVEAQQTLEEDRYWHMWLQRKLAMEPEDRTPERALRSVAIEWRNDERGDWYCYWEESYGIPTDRTANFVFSPALEVSTSGAVVSQSSKTWLETLEPPHARYAYRWLQAVLDVSYGEKSHADSRYIGWGDEGDGQWEPLFVPWDPSVSLTAEHLLDCLGAHKEVKDTVVFRSVLTDDDEHEMPGLRAVQDFLEQHEQKLIFYAGSDKLNPVPCFAVARVQEDLIVGFVGGIAHT